MDVRRVFQFLAERAVDAGVRIRTATQVTDVIRSGEAITGGRLKCGTNESLVHSRVIVDATGYRASLLKKAGVHEGFERFGVGAEYDLYAPKYDESEAVLIVGGQVAPAGYAWFLPYGRHRVRAGVGIIHKDSTGDPHEYVDLLVSKAASFRVDLRGAQPIESHYGLIPSDGVARTYTAEGIVGVGDAAGQASCLVGEGIRWAIKAGRMAGEVVAGCIQDGDISRRALIAYEKRWSTAFGRDLRVAHAINKRIARWTDEAWDRRTNLIRSLTDDQFDQALQSHFFAPWVARLLLRHPEFVSQGVRGVVKRAGLVS
jgi:digeranylgeranylglycerophospholipid reductase